MRTVIAHFAPVLGKIIARAQKAGANSSTPAIQKIAAIINSAESHPWAKMIDRIGTPAGAEAILELAADPNPKQIPLSKVAAALGVEESQIPELTECMKNAARIAKEEGAGAAASSGGFGNMLSGVLETLSKLGGGEGGAAAAEKTAEQNL